ncbi:unnamed protein product, partial [Adineta ricciae]
MAQEIRWRTILDDYIVVWLFESDQIRTNSEINQLFPATNTLKIFHQSNDCIDYTQQAVNESVILVISDFFIPEVLPEVHDLRQLHSFYVLDSNTGEYNISYMKSRGLFSNFQSVCDQFREDIHLVEETAIPVSILSSQAVSNADLNTLDPSFMYSQILKQILLEFNDNEQARRAFIQLCREQYIDNARELVIINQFEHDYERHSPAWWYTRECFLYKMLNKALRTQNFDISYQIGFFIRDLHRQIEQLHENPITDTPQILYRGQGMLIDEFKQLKKSKGGLLSFNNFLSTSTSRDTSLRFARRSLNTEGLVSILFEIQVDPAIRSIPYGSLRGVSYYPTENEVLFSMHSVFRINDIEHMHDRIWNIQLQLTKDTDLQLCKLTDYMRKQICGPNAIHRLASFMMTVRKWDTAKDVFETMLVNGEGRNANELSYISHNLGWIYEEKGDLDKSLEYYRKSIDFDLTYVPHNHTQLAPTYANMACLFEKQNKFDLAMEHYQRALTIELECSSPDQNKIASRYMNMGDLLRQLERLEEARENVKRALDI